MIRFSSLKFLWILSCSIIFLASCSSPETHLADDTSLASLDTIIIEAPKESGDKFADQNQIFDSIQYIPIESKKESIFSEINQLEVADNLLIILDWATNSILTFDMSGKFMSKITSKNVKEFAVNSKKKQIVFQDLSNQKTYHYSYDGKLEKSYETPFRRSSFAFLDSNLVAYYKYFFKEDRKNQFDNFNLFFADGSNDIKNVFLKFDTAAINYQEVYNSEKQFYTSFRSTYFIQPYDYKIYDVSAGKPIGKFLIDIPKSNRIPDDFRTNSKYYAGRFDYLTKYSDEVFQIKDFYVVNSIAAFRLSASTWNNTFLYNLDDQEKFSIYDILSGPDNNFLPLGEKFYACDNSSFYRSVTAQELFKIKFKFADKIDENKIPEDLKVFFSTQNNLSNPVIIRMFPKKNKGAKNNSI